MNAIELRGLVKEFRTRVRKGSGKPKIIRPLDGLDLDVERGTAVGLVGPNGTGKTTTLKICATVVAADAGEGTVLGIPLKKTFKVRRAVGLLTPNDRSFYWRLTGRQNLQFFGALQNLPRKEINLRADEIAARFGVDYLERRYDAYSTGMRQNLALIRALLHRPEVLLLDEPTRSLDIEHTLQFRRNLDEMLAEGKHTVLLVTHNHSLAHALCHKVCTMENGQIVRIETAQAPSEKSNCPRYTITTSLFSQTEHNQLDESHEVESIDSDNVNMLSRITTVPQPEALGSILRRVASLGFNILDVRPLPGGGSAAGPSDDDIVRNKAS